MSPRQAVRNAADATQVKDARGEEKHAEQQWAADLAALAADPLGQRVLRRLLHESNWLQTGLGATDAITNFRAGKREMGLWLIRELTAFAPASLGVLLLTPETP